MTTFIFFRKGGWYPVKIPKESDVPEHVHLNPGTIRVEDMKGRIVWPLPLKKRN